MNDHTDALLQADEDVLAHTVTDEALEAAAGMARDAPLMSQDPMLPLSFSPGCCFAV